MANSNKVSLVGRVGAQGLGAGVVSSIEVDPQNLHRQHDSGVVFRT